MGTNLPCKNSCILNECFQFKKKADWYSSLLNSSTNLLGEKINQNLLAFFEFTQIGTRALHARVPICLVKIITFLCVVFSHFLLKKKANWYSCLLNSSTKLPGEKIKPKPLVRFLKKPRLVQSMPISRQLSQPQFL